MRDINKHNKKFYAVLGMWFMIVFTLWGGTAITAYAQENSFVIEADKLPANEETYDIQLCIENQGTDWEGTVRLIVNEEYRSPAAYDTVIVLPQGSTKQFVVKVPLNSIEDTDGTIKVTLWDKNSKKSAEKEFKYFLRDEEDVLYMGILSDEYSTLTYLDMGGEELYFYGDEYPIKLVELNQDNLLEELDTLDFLVIDTYNTSVLTDEDLKAIELWNYDGGVLLVGTGSYAEDTLSGLSDSYLHMDYSNVYEQGEVGQYSYYADYVDMSMLHIAELKDMYSQYNEQYLSNAMTYSYGNGAVAVVPYALTELAKVDSSFYQNIPQAGFVQNLLEEVSSEANSRYNNSSYSYNYNTINYLRRMLRMIGSVNSPLHFGVLKFLVIVYVAFVGPILYIILRALKKRELYWVAVPSAALLGIILIYFAGRGFEVVDTRVYSVTTRNLSGKGDDESYLYCFDAKNKEWDLQLAKGYEYAGALMNDNYNYDYEDDVYYHHIKREGDTLSFGIKPSSNFEDSFFFAGMENEGAESSERIESNGVMLDVSGITGTVTNATNSDFRYYAVMSGDSLRVYENLPAGASVDLAGQIPIHTSTQKYDVFHDYMYYFLNDIKDEEEAEVVSAVAALGVGICSVYTQEDADKTFIIGVTENWDKVVDDECSELSYGCLYVVQ